MMEIRMALPQEYSQLAEMKWLHCEEDDRDYGEHTLHGVAKEEFAREFISFLNAHPEYKVFSLKPDTFTPKKAQSPPMKQESKRTNLGSNSFVLVIPAKLMQFAQESIHLPLPVELNVVIRA